MRKKIGVTTNDSSKIWSNGLNQNCYFLIKLLDKMGYDVVPLTRAEEDNTSFIDIKQEKLTEATVDNYFLILEAAYMIETSMVDICRKKKIKVVSINYGNSLFYLIEGMLHNPDSGVGIHREGVETWISPHYEFYKSFVEMTSKSKVKILPYIWEPWFIDGSLKEEYKINEKFSLETDKTNVACLEPNISISKNFITPLYIAEALERDDSSIIKNMCLYGSKHMAEEKNFKKLTESTDLFRARKLTIELRYSLIKLLNQKKFGIVISNHFYNDLNYVTLESLYLNYPIIHNSEFCKEAGYFYPKFDVSIAKEKLKQAIQTNDHISKNALEASKEVLWGFSIKNPLVQERYRELIKSAQ
jgi:hypothetical protein